jgi:mRNA interferase RelE/StbE
MTWAVRYHPAGAQDLRALGRAQAAAIMKAIDARIHRGNPEQSGKPLAGELTGYRRLRVGSTRIVYRVDKGREEVLVLAVGPRRREEVYRKSERRI